MKQFILGIMLIACTVGPALAETTLKWVGCGITKKAFMTELATAYEIKTGVKIDIQGGGATRGIHDTAATDKDVDLGGSCRFMLPEEKDNAIKAKPVAWDALVVIAHKNNPVDDISLAELRALYRGEITNWSQLGGPDRPLKLLVREGKISGVGFMLRKLAFNDPGMEFPSDHVFKSSGPLEKAVVEDEGAIAVSGISSARQRDLKILRLEGKVPNYDNIKNGDYLLYRPLYVIINHKKPQAAEAERFIDFALSEEGREVIRNNDIVPYKDAYHLITKMIRQNREAFNKMGGMAGTGD